MFKTQFGCVVKLLLTMAVKKRNKIKIMDVWYTYLELFIKYSVICNVIFFIVKML